MAFNVDFNLCLKDNDIRLELFKIQYCKKRSDLISEVTEQGLIGE